MSKCERCGAPMIELFTSIACRDACEKQIHVKMPLTQVSLQWQAGPIPRGVFAGNGVVFDFPLWLKGTAMTRTGVSAWEVAGLWCGSTDPRYGRTMTRHDPLHCGWHEIRPGEYEVTVPAGTEDVTVMVDRCATVHVRMP